MCATQLWLTGDCTSGWAGISSCIQLMCHVCGGFSNVTCCRYVPNAQLAFEYPDDSYDQLCAAAPLGADGNLLMRDDPMSQVLFPESVGTESTCSIGDYLVHLFLQTDAAAMMRQMRSAPTPSAVPHR